MAGSWRSAEWMDRTVEEGVGFDLIHIAPGLCFGRHPFAASIAELMASSNAALLKIITTNNASAVGLGFGQAPYKECGTGCPLG